MIDYCIAHKRKHNSQGWKNKGQGWYCADDVTYPEFVPEYIKEDRKKNLKSQIQSHRGGELSSEFVKHYPDKIQGMLREGVITREEVRRAKPVWKDLPNYHNLDKTQ